MNRERSLARLTGELAARRPWDVLVIGGGATGLGAAVDAAARGYRTALLEGAARRRCAATTWCRCPPPAW